MEYLFAKIVQPFFEEKLNTDDYYMYSKPIIPIFTTMYLFFVLRYGQLFMQNRKPYNLKYILLVYNLLQVIANFYLALLTIVAVSYYRPYDMFCITPVPDDHPVQQLEFKIAYYYCLLKFCDYFDTICFVLRKSYKQITFLHVYHHVFMSVGSYFYLQSMGPSQTLIMATMNEIVHVIMYGYYFISVLKPKMKESIWWKKYITIIQLIQFIINFYVFFHPLYFRPDCPTEKFILFSGVFQSAAMFIMFTRFYRKTYIKKDSGKKIVDNMKIKDS